MSAGDYNGTTREDMGKGGKQEIETRKRLMELFPRLSYDTYTNKKLKDITLEDTQDTPKNHKIRNRFHSRNNTEQNDQSMSIVSKQTDRFGSKIKNPYQKSFTYESVHNYSRQQNKKDFLDKIQINKRGRIVTQPYEEVDSLFTSLEENLSQCDKILEKLGGYDPEVRKTLKPTKRTIPIQWNRQIQIPSSLSIRRQSKAFLEQYQSAYQNDEDLINRSSFLVNLRKQGNDNPYKSHKITKQSLINRQIPKQQIRKQRYKSMNIDKHKQIQKREFEPSLSRLKKQSFYQQQQGKVQYKSKQLTSQQQQRPSSQLKIDNQPSEFNIQSNPQANNKYDLQSHTNRNDQSHSIIQMRRKRVNQILKTCKTRTDNPIELSFNRLKQRGENMFNRVLRVKEKSKGGEYVYQSDMVEKFKHHE